MERTGLFVTGTDTGCGKTAISLGLMGVLRARGERVCGMKPVASGATRTPKGWRNDDALRLMLESEPGVAYAAVNPYLFEPPIAPHLAAVHAGVAIESTPILDAFSELARAADQVIVEGVGGWRVPLGAKWDLSDLALLLGLPVVLAIPSVAVTNTRSPAKKFVAGSAVTVLPDALIVTAPT